VLAALVRRDGYDVTIAEDGEMGLAEFQKNGADAVITDLVMPSSGNGGAGPSTPPTPRCRSSSSPRTARSTRRWRRSLGAFDYVTKPFDQTGSPASWQAIRSHESAWRNARGEHGRPSLVGESPQMQEVLRIIDKVADTPSTVLITGESGTGKELIATALHKGSSRHDKPFIRINCAAIPRDLIESELFGYERGAFTGAVTSKPGRFELADGGTLFLDEIGEVPVEMQVKLLRALQESEFERVGGIKTLRVDVRLIAATNRDLKALIADGRFREDLYYRLPSCPSTSPAQGGERHPHLVRHFVGKYNHRLNKRIEGMTDEALALVQAYAWPGNIRELENLIERTLLFADGPRIGVGDLPQHLRSPGVTPVPGPAPAALPVPPGETGLKDIVRQRSAELEKDLITRALEETGGNVTRAAKLLQISRKSLQTKMKEFSLRDDGDE
jgi:DNA-binding NtrC family response regulator